ELCAARTAADDGLRLWQLSGRSLAPLAALNAPALQWIQDANVSDGWLEDEVRHRLQVGRPWSNMTAAALVARYLEPRGAMAKEWASSLVNGGVVPALAAPRQW